MCRVRGSVNICTTMGPDLASGPCRVHSGSMPSDNDEVPSYEDEDDTPEVCLECGDEVDERHSGSGVCRGCCSECREESGEYSERYLHDYSYRPTPIWWTDRGAGTWQPGTPYLGVELEVEAPDCESVPEVVSITEHEHPSMFYCKHDGSLDEEGGVEIVTMPGTQGAHASLFPWESILPRLSAWGVRSWETDTCGLHVHISRDSMSRAELWRFARLIDGNPEQISRFAGRKSSEWARFASEESHEVICGKTGAFDRYRAVNLTNSGTVEVRVFRGSLNPCAVRGAIELVDAARTYAKSLTFSRVQSGALRWPLFSAWAHNRRAEYPHLVQRIDQRVGA